MAYSLDLSGRVAFVTGASSGLGAQFAKTLASAGAAVVLASRRTERLKSLRIDIEAQGGQAHVVSLDVTDALSIEAAVEQAEAEVGPIDILINNSGVSATQRLLDVKEEDFDFIFNTNVRGALLPQIGVYCMSKAAVVQMTKAMAIEWGRYGINVNAICPGYIDTEINHHHWETEQGKKLVNMFPKKRLGQPQDLDALLVMLASPQSDFINGAVISADDGFSI